MAINLIASDRTITSIKRDSPDRPRRLSDGAGLYLLLWADGGSHGWRFDYTRPDGRRNTVSFGTYPAVSLALARQRRAEARALVAAGQDPAVVRESERAAAAKQAEIERLVADGKPAPGSFEQLAREFYARKSPSWSASYAERWIGRLVADVFPYVVGRAAGSIAPREWLEIFQRVEDRGAVDSARKLRQYVSTVYRYAIPLQAAETDPTRDLALALKQHVVRHYAAVTTPGQARELMRQMMRYRGTPTVRAALQLAAMVFQRPGNIRAARWSDIDLDTATWTIPAADMKRRKAGKLTGAPHIVPLATQAVALLRELRHLTGWSEWVFPGRGKRAQHMSENTLGQALRSMGWHEQMTAHGFRAMAMTMLVDHAGIAPEIVDAQLAHAKKGPLGAAYDRAEYLAQRRDMMQRWADYLFKLADRPQAG